MTKFEDNLWREVEQKYGSELAQAPGPVHSQSRLRGPMLAGTSLGIVGAGTAAVLVLTAAGSSPAFAVTTQSNGTVSVVIRRIEGIRGANRRLAQLGIHARAVRVADGCQVLAPRALKPVPLATLVRNGHSNWIRATAGTAKAEIQPAQIPIGRTLLIPAVRAGSRVRLVRGHAVRGLVPACLQPAVLVRSSFKGGVVRVIACQGGVPLNPVPGRIVVRPPVSTAGAETNTTSTNAGPPSATVTETTASPATTTDSGTATSAGTATDSGTTTGAGTATDSGTATGSGTTPSPTSPRTVVTTLPSPLVRACRLAGRAAAR
jgi:hypothetical protein